MKFGKLLREKTLKEWRFYAVDYKALKRSLKDDTPNVDDFSASMAANEHKLSKFYHDKEQWAKEYMNVLEERVAQLRATAPSSPRSGSITEPSSDSDAQSLSSDDETEDGNVEVAEGSDIIYVPELESGFLTLTSKRQSFGTHQAYLKEEYRRMGSSKHFNAFIYAKKSLVTFDRELDLLLEFLDLNKTAMSKIFKKYDKRAGTSIRDNKVDEILAASPYLNGQALCEMKKHVGRLIDEVHALKPQLPEGWENRKVYTIGCFDLFHRGHQNVLNSLREFGCFIVAGIHDDASYYQLKSKAPIDKLEDRMENIRPYVDQIFVIPSTDPMPFVKAMVSRQDIVAGSCCYARGDDMLEFPGRDWVESVMPVHFVPRTEACSSTLIRTIYHAEDEGIRAKAAFAKTRYDGKPIDEDGNVLKLTASA
ncbi:hypothetical protein MPSEU_000813700 [Mayamaea pseudoterrestris]|nr:hypothetical protein MPSEU_000813700 [Mayamaea pseudoterrestris]